MQNAEEHAWRQLVSSEVVATVIAVGDVEMFAVSAGDGATPVVFVNGLGEATPTWAPVLPNLASTCRVVAYDRPGMGASPPATGARSLERMGSELNGLLAELGEAPAVLVGHSLGGLIAIEAYRRRPEQVAGLVLIDPADPKMIRRRGLVAIQRVALWLPRALAALGLWGRIARSAARKEAAAAAGPEAQGALASALLENLLSAAARKATSDELSGMVRSVRGGVDATSAIPIEVPLTVLSATSGGTGKKSRAEWTDGHRLLVGASPAGHHREVDGGHYLHREQPSVVATSS